MTRREWLVACGSAGLAVRGLAAQDYPSGMFVGTPDGPQELAVYAERTPLGRIRPLRMSIDDAQTIAGEVRVICNLPNWELRTIFLSTRRLFTDETAERRTLPSELRRLTVSAVFARVVDSGDPVRWRKLLTDVGASADNPPYVFVTMASDGQMRDFVIGIALDA